jgi:hypothetical protein
LRDNVVDYDKNLSPVGWYLGRYLLRFMELNDPQRNEPERKFFSWENTVLVRAKTFDEAYAKVGAIGKSNATRYRGGPSGVPVKWQYIGVTEVLPIYEKIEDGTEIAWAEHAPRTLRKLRARARTKEELKQ